MKNIIVGGVEGQRQHWQQIPFQQGDQQERWRNQKKFQDLDL